LKEARKGLGGKLPLSQEGERPRGEVNGFYIPHRKRKGSPKAAEKREEVIKNPRNIQRD